MDGDFLDALRQIEKEKEIPLEVLLATIEKALESAYKKNYATSGEVRVRVATSKSGKFKVFCQKDAVLECSVLQAAFASVWAIVHSRTKSPNTSAGSAGLMKYPCT